MYEEREVFCNGRGCENKKMIDYPASHDDWFRRDAYSIPTGLFCDDCFENNYPYKRDRYEHDEPLEADY